MLEHHADMAAQRAVADLLALVAKGIAHRLLTKADRAIGWHFHVVETADEGGFAGAGRADQGDDFTTGQRKVEAFQHFMVAIALAQRNGFDDRGFRRGTVFVNGHDISPQSLTRRRFSIQSAAWVMGSSMTM